MTLSSPQQEVGLTRILEHECLLQREINKEISAIRLNSDFLIAEAFRAVDVYGDGYIDSVSLG
jgi:hypothetical protein